MSSRKQKNLHAIGGNKLVTTVTWLLCVISGLTRMMSREASRIQYILIMQQKFSSNLTFRVLDYLH